jgi:hypothetical protein
MRRGGSAASAVRAGTMSASSLCSGPAYGSGGCVLPVACRTILVYVRPELRGMVDGNAMDRRSRLTSCYVRVTSTRISTLATIERDVRGVHALHSCTCFPHLESLRRSPFVVAGGRCAARAANKETCNVFDEKQLVGFFFALTTAARYRQLTAYQEHRAVSPARRILPRRPAATIVL